MKFFHVYNEDCLKGLEINGLLNKDSGFMVKNVFSVPKDCLFHNIATKGGKLHQMIKADKIPLTGENGPYDPVLLKKILVRDSAKTPEGMVLQALS